jgi:hypothetical protein
MACFCTGLCRTLGYCPTNIVWPPPIITEGPITFTPVDKKLGWICPQCGRGNAPTRLECPCFKEKKKDGRQQSERS